jgi:hypothetical protein
MFGVCIPNAMKTTDRAQSLSLAIDPSPVHAVWGRRNSHLLAYGFFVLGVGYSWCMAGEAISLSQAACLLAIAWFPAVIVEMFRRVSIENPAVAAALLSAIAGYDGILRLFGHWAGGC